MCICPKPHHNSPCAAKCVEDSGALHDRQADIPHSFFHGTPLLAYSLFMRFVLGFDGGGTKTHCVLMDELLRVRAESRSGPSNPLRVGFGGALASVCESARLAMQSANIPATDVAVICAGLAGTAQLDAQQKMKRLLTEEFSGKVVHVCTDLELSLESTGEGPAIVLIAGTGSAAVGRGLEGQILRVGGHGTLLSDEGSSFDVGRRAASAALREFDRLGANTALGTKILSETEVADWQEFQSRAQAIPDEVFPKLFSVVAESAAQGDTAALALLHQAVLDLVGLVRDLIGRLQLSDRRFLFLKSGGMLGRFFQFDAELDKYLLEAAPHAEFGALAISPAEAAARMAVRLLPQPSAARD
jgi:N-acetylglucosamine kinase-like BadF-type ATPase